MNRYTMIAGSAAAVAITALAGGGPLTLTFSNPGSITVAFSTPGALALLGLGGLLSTRRRRA